MYYGGHPEGRLTPNYPRAGVDRLSCGLPAESGKSRRIPARRGGGDWAAKSSAVCRILAASPRQCQRHAHEPA